MEGDGSGVSPSSSDVAPAGSGVAGGFWIYAGGVSGYAGGRPFYVGGGRRHGGIFFAYAVRWKAYECPVKKLTFLIATGAGLDF